MKKNMDHLIDQQGSAIRIYYHGFMTKRTFLSSFFKLLTVTVNDI